VPRTGVFLDRDDTIIRDVPYLSDPEQIELLPEVPEAIRFLNENTILAIIITNQSGIARGFLDEGILSTINERIVGLLAAKGASIDAIYYCPHHPEGVLAPYSRTCECRKPAPGMLLKAAHDYDLDLTNCYMIGDKAIDVETILCVGGIGIHVTREGGPSFHAHYVAVNLIEAVQWILLDKMRRT
jgi:D-glycero-D-manno-heptose 1,7-bisphosphate phosphatase